MKTGKKKDMDEKIPRNSSGSARNLRRKELGGVIFGCTRFTINDCLANLIFGLPATHFSYVKNVEPGLPLFLFNYSDRKLHGIYEAAGHGKMNINPYGWTTTGSDNTHYPAQVRVRIQKQCQALSEDTFKKILDKNYSEDQVHFQFELDKAQTSQLLSLFEPLSVTRSPASSSNSRVFRPHNRPATDRGTRKKEDCKETLDKVEGCSKKFNVGSKMTAVSQPPKLQYRPVIDRGTRKKEEHIETSDNVDACSKDFNMGSKMTAVSQPPKLQYRPVIDCGTRKKEEHMETPDNVDACSKDFNMGSKMPASSPPPKLKWISQIKSNSDSGSDREGDDEPLVLRPNMDEEANASIINSDPKGIIICLENEINSREKESWPSGDAPCLKEENKVAETPTETMKSDVEDIYIKLQQLALDKGNSSPKKHSEDVSIPCEAENAQLADECSHAEPSETETENSNSVEGRQCAFHWGANNSDLKEGGPLATRLSSDMKSSNSEEDTEDVSFPCRSNNSDLDDECSPTKPPTSEESIKSADVESVIDQLLKEMKEMQTFQIDQQQKSKLLEKELDDSEILLKYLRHRVMVLESSLQTSAKAAHNDSYCADPVLGVGEAIFIMGGYDGLSWLSTVDSYSPTKGISKSVNPMNSVRSYSSATVLNGLIYNFGGWNDHFKIWYDTAECYNPLTNEWISCPSLSERKGCLASASFNDKIYAVGGGNGADCFKEVEMFDPALGRWIRTQSMLQKRFASAAATLDGVLYVVGGYNGKTYLRSAERYDPREASWSKLQPMNTSRGSHALSVLDGKLYALGGYDGSKYVSTMEVFDPRNGSWIEGDEMRQSRGYFAAPVIGETIYAIGGQAETNNIVDSVETYRVGHGWSTSKMDGIGKRCFFSAAVY